MRVEDDTSFNMIFSLTWSIWNLRNKLIFNGALLFARIVVVETLLNMALVPTVVQLDDGDVGALLGAVAQSIDNGTSTCGWEPSATRTVNINFDASYSQSQCGGFELITRNEVAGRCWLLPQSLCPHHLWQKASYFFIGLAYCS